MTLGMLRENLIGAKFVLFLILLRRCLKASLDKKIPQISCFARCEYGCGEALPCVRIIRQRSTASGTDLLLEIILPA
jgi:hypothetical protein